ncbi:hypothetical protein [Candidatus Electronema sp. PJ]|uniref:hypothetical protein n=1 Tax=Candidatus Electronema sp. PJ TaxID=3401572 RepID=UPI003AA938C8
MRLRTVRFSLIATALTFISVSVGYAANIQPLNIPPADVADPLYSAPLGVFLPARPATLPPVNPAIVAVRNPIRDATMRTQAGLRPLMREITPIVGGNVMAYVRQQVLDSLSNPANTNGIAQRIVPFQ